MTERIRDFDWQSTQVGAIGNWTDSLKATVAIMLASPEPVSIVWGADRIQVYNDAYVPIAAERHPGALEDPLGKTGMKHMMLF
jgi:hypothetical protein